MGIPWMQLISRSTGSLTRSVACLSSRRSVSPMILAVSSTRQKQRKFTRMMSNCCTEPSPGTPAITGRFQSPIDLISSAAVFDQPLANRQLQVTNHASIFTLNNTGYTFDAQPDSSKTYVLSGGPLSNPYTLVGFHFHWIKDGKPWSEHTVDDKEYAAELHLVHLNKVKYNSVEQALHHNDGLCVLGVFLEAGNIGHEKLGELTKFSKEIEHKSKTYKMTQLFSPYSLLPDDIHSYWTYPGSLTTPPYSECVTWIVFKDTICVSNEQMEQFNILKPISQEETEIVNLENNVRETQQMCGRILKSTFAI